VLLLVPPLAQLKPEGRGSLVDAVWRFSLLGPEQ